MGWNLFKKKKTDINYLETTPSRNYDHETNDKGLIDILVPKFQNKFLKKHLTPRMRAPYIRANLDEFGTATWLLIDGNNKVKEIADGLTDQFGEKVQPVYDRLTTFLTHLYYNGFISFNELSKGNKNG